MSDDPRADWVPRLREDLVITELPLTDPFEGFILSRIDGDTNLRDIADSTGATLEQVLALLQRLKELKALDSEGNAESPVVRPGETDAEKRASAPPPSARPSAAPEPAYDPVELEEEADLDRDRKHEILDTFHRLADLSYYELLGVSRDADKKAIRAAYFGLSKRFHPDTLYGKQLGTFKTKMEKVFEHLTRAYDTLGKKKLRREYDEYIAMQDQTRALETELQAGEEVAAEIEQAGDADDAMATAPTEPPPGTAKPDPKKAPAVEAPEIPKAPRTPRVSAEDRKARAKALFERRMRGGTSSAPAPSAASSAPSSSEPPAGRKDRKSLLEGLTRSLKGTAAVTGGADPAAKHVKEADEALANGDRLTAINSLKLALALDPEREGLAERHDELRAELAAEMAETYQKQALYEENQGNWEAAARSWQKVAEGRPKDPRPRRKAALALAESRGDLKVARDLAQKAVELAPQSVANRAALVRVYIAAKMQASARKELEEAAKLDPNAEIVKTLQQELK